jgi:hypothetical protein
MTITGLPTADRLARGDLEHYRFGQKMPHKLTPHEWPAYEAAKETGYLVTPNSGLSRVRLRNCYWCYCVDVGRPFVATELRQRWAAVELDLIGIPPRPTDRDISRKLSDQAFKQLKALLGEVTRRGAWWSSGHVFAYSSAIPITQAHWMAARMFSIACVDLRGGI